MVGEDVDEELLAGVVLGAGELLVRVRLDGGVCGDENGGVTG